MLRRSVRIGSGLVNERTNSRPREVERSFCKPDMSAIRSEWKVGREGGGSGRRAMTVNLGTGTHTFPAYPGKIVGDLISLPTTTLTRPPRRVLGRLPALILQKLGEIPICFAHSSILSDLLSDHRDVVCRL